MTNAGDSEALTCGDIKKYRAPMARIIHLSEDRPAGNRNQQSEVDEREHVFVRVERSHQGGAHRCNRAWR